MYRGPFQLITRAHLAESGGRSRVRRTGPEKDLVDRFLTDLPVYVPRSRRLSIFEEPRLESGFPDLVLVIWDESKTQNWRQQRDKLHSEDFKVLQLLHTNPKLTEYHLERILASSVDRSLERLIAAGMLVAKRSRLTLPPLKTIFAIDYIVALEAKVSNVQAGLDQAILNTWFANESVLLLPQTIRNSASRERALQWNIRILTPDPWDRIEPRRRNTGPVSYASWQFNEWLWRAHKRNLL